MRIKQLECFIDLCHTTSLTKTAKNMHMAIPSLSETIDRMESEIGCNLFQKTSKGYFLNEIGEVFYNEVRPIVIQYQNALNKISGYHKENTIKFGIDSAIYPFVLSTILAQYQKENKSESLQLVNCNYKDYKNALLHNQIDICYCHKLTPLPKQFEFVPLLDNDICVVASKNNPLMNKLSIKIDDLSDQTIYYDSAFETFQTKKIINYLAKKNPAIIIYDSTKTNISMLEVELNNGIMIMHKDKKDTYTANMTLKPISGYSETFGIVYLKDDEKLLTNIIDSMKKYFK